VGVYSAISGAEGKNRPLTENAAAAKCRHLHNASTRRVADSIAFRGRSHRPKASSLSRPKWPQCQPSGSRFSQRFPPVGFSRCSCFRLGCYGHARRPRMGLVGLERMAKQPAPPRRPKRQSGRRPQPRSIIDARAHPDARRVGAAIVTLIASLVVLIETVAPALRAARIILRDLFP
jgi:hypothetical protein